MLALVLVIALALVLVLVFVPVRDTLDRLLLWRDRWLGKIHRARAPQSNGEIVIVKGEEREGVSGLMGG